MKNQYFNEWEFKKVFSLFHSDPIECKKRYEEYLEKYPQDYYTYTFYIGVLIELGEFENAEKVLNYVVNVSGNDKSFLKQENKLKTFEENIFFCNLKLLAYKEEFQKLYELCKNNYNLIEKLSLQTVDFYAKIKNNIINLESRENISYSLRQIVEYKESDFKEHIKKHLADYIYNIDNPNKNIFMAGFPIEKVIDEIKKYIPSNKCLFTGFFENAYFFKYTSCGKDNNKTVDFIKVVCFHNTQNFITMLPCSDGENLPYVDLDYLINTNDLPKIKTINQIEKFNKRFNHKLKNETNHK